MEAWKHKKDVLQLQQISDQLKYLLDHGITSPEDAAARKEDLEKERKAAGSAFNAAKASFYMDHVCQLMRRRKKLLERKAAGENVEKQILALENEIEGQIPLPEAEERFAERREKYDEHRIQMKMLKKQIRLVDQILEEVSSLPPIHELTREQDQIREKEMIRSEKILERNEEKRRE